MLSFEILGTDFMWTIFMGTIFMGTLIMGNLIMRTIILLAFKLGKWILWTMEWILWIWILWTHELGRMSNKLGPANMKIVYMGIFENEAKPAVQLVCERELSSYNRFTKGSISEFMTFFAGEVAARTKPGQRQDVEEKEYIFHAYGRTEGVCGMIITDAEYPKLVAHQLLSKVVDEFVSKYPRSAYAGVTSENIASKSFPFPELKEYIQKYQDPQQADSIMKIQKELDETKIVLHKTIESVLERGEKIDNLVAKSDGLSAQSKMFYTQAKKQNSCCVVM